LVEFVHVNTPRIKTWRGLRRCLIGLFYTEELWRGRRAWENCRTAMEARGIKVDWANYIPPPVPADENVFGVPEMQRWFGDGLNNELSKILARPDGGHIGRMVVAELTLGPPDAAPPAGATVLAWGDFEAKSKTAGLITDAVGPVVMTPTGEDFILREPKKIRPTKIFLQCQSGLTEKQLLSFLPRPIANTILPDTENIRLEPAGSRTYQVTMDAPVTVAQFLKWNESLEPTYALIRRALQRPYAHIPGDYSNPLNRPVMNFVEVRFLAQRVTAMAQCHLLAGQPDAALRDLTLLQGLSRMLEDHQPVTLAPAMIDGAMNELYALPVADGIRWRAWRDPQLLALEEQQKQVNLQLVVQKAFETEQARAAWTLDITSPAFNLRNSLAIGLFPRGWVFQNMVDADNLLTNYMAIQDSSRQIYFPDKCEACLRQTDSLFSHWSPFTYIARLAAPNYSGASQRTARDQTAVNETLVACALERHRLARGEYPETLDALVPQFIDPLPHDVIGGEPLHYRRATDGTFVLYSIGWNAVDDGGVRSDVMTNGDWVWP
jgi:hypothetical protein